MADYNLSYTGLAIQRILNKIALWIQEKIQTDDIANKAISLDKLDDELQDDIIQISTNKSNISKLQTSKVDTNVVNILSSKVDNIHAVLAEMLGKGVFTAAIINQLYEDESSLGKVIISLDPITNKASLSAANSSAIYYTTDGTSPTTSSSKYSSEIALADGDNLKAIATDGTNTSLVPALNATYDASIKTIALSTDSGTISYKKDDGEITAYSEALDVSLDAVYTIYINGIEVSSITIEDAIPDNVEITLDTEAQSATLAAGNSTDIYYTTDGTTPTTSSSRYASAISLESGNTITAIATNGVNTTSKSSVSATYDASAKTLKLTAASGTIAVKTSAGATASTTIDASTAESYNVYVNDTLTTTIIISE